MKKQILLTAGIALCAAANAQLSPAITAWIINPGGETGYNGIPSNVLEVVYDAANVYVGCAGIPGYDIGPWIGNPNDAGNQDWEFRITLVPEENTGNPVNTPLGHVGVWTNGVTIFNPRDAMSFNMQGIWNQNAFFFEGADFDDCLGHPSPQMEYHTHINPTCLYDDTDSSAHSPIIGFAFDGFPIYGAFGYADVDGTGGITRMRSSYRVRNITDRSTLADGTVLNTGQYGPAISAQFPLGAYIEDHELVQGLGHLDEHNGRFCITPEYPSGTYAYFVSLDAGLEPAYPYVIGPAYYGTVQPGNTGPGSGHNDVPPGVTVYDPFTGLDDVADQGRIHLFPNPTVGRLVIDGLTDGEWTFKVYDTAGSLLMDERVQGGAPAAIDLRHSDPGGFVLVALKGTARTSHRFVISR